MTVAVPRHERFLAGGGEMGERMRALDWSKTPLGPVGGWPQSLLSAVSMLLPSKAQICFFWGPEFVVFYNDAYRPVFGAKHPQALGQPGRVAWSEIWEGEINLHGLLAGVVSTGEAFAAKDLFFPLERHGFAEETFFDVSYDPVRDESGAVGGVFCIVTETTGRVVGERRLALLRDLAARNATARTPREACLLAMEMLAARPDIPFALAFLGGELQACTPGAEAALAAADRKFVREIPFPPEGRLVVGLNPQRPLDEPYLSFLDLVTGQIATAVANATAYDDARRRAEQLAELDRAKTAFFSNVSHEFRTPLTLMLGPIEDGLADETEPLAGAQRERLELARRSGQRLQKLVNTMLDFARIEAGRAQATYAPVDLAALTADLASSFRSAVEKAGLRLRVECPALDAPAWVDRDMWEKIVLNLISNAFKFTFDGEIAVALAQEPGRFVLRVSDTGTGIPAAEVPHLFERFHRVQGARSRTHEGTGIGLALVQELVRLHCGSIEVQSREGQGTQFTVVLPAGSAHLPRERVAARPTAASTGGAAPFVDEALRWLPGAARAAQAAEPEQGAGGGPRARVVLADDNADMREYVRRLLAPAYDVEACANGEEALRAIRERRPDLVLSDVMMPGLDGFGLIAALRADPATRSVPVVLVSARAGEEARVEGLRAGADDYIVKPFSARELLARVSARLELSAEARVLEVLNRVGGVLTAELALEPTVQAVTDAATQVSGAEFGAFFYNVQNAAGESYMLYTLSGAPREAFEKFGMPRNTAIFAPTFAGEGIVRIDDVTKDGRYGKNAPHRGMPKGHLPVCSYLAAPVVSRSGEVIGGLFFGHSRPGVFTERSERLVAGIATQAAIAIDNARLYEKTTRLVDELRDSDRRKDEFLAILSHELRNPLAPITNAVTLLHHAGDDPRAREQAQSVLERQVRHMVRLVDDLLDVARVNRGEVELRKARVRLDEVLASAVETSRPLVDGGAHRLAIDVAAPGAVLDGDAVRLAQAFSNLINNAAIYTPRGGRIEVGAQVRDGVAEVTVRDSGPGIPAELLPQLFQMFRRGNSSQHRASGFGVGLALARRLVEMHGGTIEAGNAASASGAEFKVRLPLAAPAAAAETAAAKHAGATTSKRILIVDDNRDAADSLGMVLKVLGADVRVEHDGKAALAAYDDYRPRVVLLDIGMPGMDGYEVAQAIRMKDPSRRAALVALTGWGQERDRERATAAGFDHHLVKPAEIGTLQTLLDSMDRPAS